MRSSATHEWSCVWQRTQSHCCCQLGDDARDDQQFCDTPRVFDSTLPLILILSSRLDRGIQSATEMLLFKRGSGGVAYSSTTLPRLSDCLILCYVYTDFRVTVEASRGGALARRKAYSDRSQYDDYPDYYYHYQKPTEPITGTRRPLSQHRRPPVPTPSVLKIKCYSCVYTWKENDWTGKKGCGEPFDPFNIHQENCTGPCAVTRATFTVFMHHKW